MLVFSGVYHQKNIKDCNLNLLKIKKEHVGTLAGVPGICTTMCMDYRIFYGGMVREQSARVLSQGFPMVPAFSFSLTIQARRISEGIRLRLPLWGWVWGSKHP